jgi:cell division septum initiation protein DivIVA
MLEPFVKELGDVREELGREKESRERAEERVEELEAELAALREARESPETVEEEPEGARGAPVRHRRPSDGNLAPVVEVLAVVGPQDPNDVARDTARDLPGLAGELAALKGDAAHWLTSSEYEALKHRLEDAHATVEASLIEARRRVRMNEGR